MASSRCTNKGVFSNHTHHRKSHCSNSYRSYLTRLIARNNLKVEISPIKLVIKSRRYIRLLNAPNYPASIHFPMNLFNIRIGAVYTLYPITCFGLGAYG